MKAFMASMDSDASKDSELWYSFSDLTPILIKNDARPDHRMIETLHLSTKKRKLDSYEFDTFIEVNGEWILNKPVFLFEWAYDDVFTRKKGRRYRMIAEIIYFVEDETTGREMILSELKGVDVSYTEIEYKKTKAQPA